MTADVNAEQDSGLPIPLLGGDGVALVGPDMSISMIAPKRNYRNLEDVAGDITRIWSAGNTLRSSLTTYWTAADAFLLVHVSFRGSGSQLLDEMVSELELAHRKCPICSGNPVAKACLAAPFMYDSLRDGVPILVQAGLYRRGEHGILQRLLYFRDPTR